MSDSFGDLNAVGEPKSIGRMGSNGGNDGRGPIDNVLPTGALTDGPDWSRGDAGAMKGVRADMSISKNRSISKRGMGSSR